MSLKLGKFMARIYYSRYRGVYLFLLIFAILSIKYKLSEVHEQTLILDNERHLFIRLFKQNDQSRSKIRPFRILSGSLHYFRVLPQSWLERIEQMKAAGLNTIETYVPWNIHEPEIGNFKFNDLIKFLELVHQHEMFTIIRPSGYICAEWDWGGLPSWLLRDDKMRVRTTYPGFIEPLGNYYAALLPILSKYQYNRHGPGSIIAFQIENEYGSYGNDKDYLKALHSMYIEYGLTELFFTSDGAYDLSKGTLSNIWATINFQRFISKNLDKFIDFRSTKHIMIAEYWTGWFDYWGGKHKTGNKAPYNANEFESDLEEILLKSKFEISINFYMFFGGTNFGFTSGAHHFPNKTYSPLVTSYDYNAPISEAGDLTDKYYAVQRVINKFYKKHPKLLIRNHERSGTDKFQLSLPKITMKISYGKININGYKTFDQILSDDLLASKYELDEGPLCMEEIKKGQSQGFIIYTKSDMEELIKETKQHSIKIPSIGDNALVLVNNEKIYQSNHTENLIQFNIPANTKILSIIVENMGRINYGPTLNLGRKGILSTVLLDNTIELKKWTVHLLEFCKGTLHITNWKPYVRNNESKINELNQGPNLFHASFTIENEESIHDTFLLLDSNWTKGVAFINGFNLGRYWNIGPQKTLYVSKHLLMKGTNHIDLFELYTYGQDLQLVDTPIIDA